MPESQAKERNQLAGGNTRQLLAFFTGEVHLVCCVCDAGRCAAGDDDCQRVLLVRCQPEDEGHG